MIPFEPKPLAIPLLPLQSVLFPQGSLLLKEIEPVYVQLIQACIKTKAPLGIVSVTEVKPPQSGQPPGLSHIGTLASITKTSEQHDRLHVQCHGTQRFYFEHISSGTQGLWIAQDASLVAPDAPTMIPQAMQRCRTLLIQLTSALIMQNKLSFSKPFYFEDAAWVANRWAELLPLSLDKKIALLGTVDPTKRLNMIFEHLDAHFMG